MDATERFVAGDPLGHQARPELDREGIEPEYTAAAHARSDPLHRSTNPFYSQYALAFLNKKSSLERNTALDTNWKHLSILAVCIACLVPLAFAAQAGATAKWPLSPSDEVTAALPVEAAAKAEGTLTLTSKIAGVKVEFSCTGLALNKTLLEAEGKSSGKATFSGCAAKLNGTVSKPCEPHVGSEKGVIATEALKGQLVNNEGTTLERIESLSGAALAWVKTSEECSIGEEIQVFGVLYLKDANGSFGTLAESHLLTEGPLSELWVITKTAEHKATLGGSAKVSLTGAHAGRWWSGSGSEVVKWALAPTDEVTAALPVEAAAKAESTLTLTSKIAGVKVEFSCTGLALNKALLEAEGKGSGKATFSGCTTKLNGTVSKLCEPFVGTEKGMIGTESLKGQLVNNEGTTLERVEPLSGSALASIHMDEECAVGEGVQVIGTLYLKDVNGSFGTLVETHLLAEGPLSELWVISKTAEHKATLGGSAKVSLTGAHAGRWWSGSGA